MVQNHEQVAASKRKLSSEEPVLKKTKVDSEVQDESAAKARIKAMYLESDAKFEAGAPYDVMVGLLKPLLVHEFEATYWEKRPKHIVRGKDEKQYYGTACSREALETILKEHELNFGDDADVYKLSPETCDKNMKLGLTGRVSIEKVDELKKDGAVVEVLNPQRYSDILWNLVEKCESFFGSVCESRLIMTPAKTEQHSSFGCSPHCDDSESFILQLEGEMHWKVYKPLMELSHESQDFTLEEIKKREESDLVENVHMVEGDLLYIPRGYIHCAVNEKDSSSTRLELLTFRNNSWGNLMNRAVNQAVENALDTCQDKSFRMGLKRELFSHKSAHGTINNLQKYIVDEDNKSKLSSNEHVHEVCTLKNKMKERFARLVDQIDTDVAIDNMKTEFMNNRMPPFDFVPNGKEYQPPTKNDQVMLKHKEHILMRFYAEDSEVDMHEGYDTEDEGEMTEGEFTEDEMTEEECTEDEDEKMDVATNEEKKEQNGKDEAATEEDDDDENDADYVPTTSSRPRSYSRVSCFGLEDSKADCVKVIHSLHNSRKMHMKATSSKASSLKFGLTFAPALHYLSTSSEYTRVTDLPGFDSDDSDAEKVTLAKALYDAGLLAVKPKNVEPKQ